MLVCVFLNIPLSKPQVGSNSLLDLMNHICIHCLRGPASAQLCFSAYKILNQVLFFVHREKCVGPDQAQHLVHFLDRSGRCLLGFCKVACGIVLSSATYRQASRTKSDPVWQQGSEFWKVPSNLPQQILDNFPRSWKGLWLYSKISQLLGRQSFILWS